MAKPICIIYIPEHYSVGTRGNRWIFEYADFLNGNQNPDSNISWGKSEVYSDYLWFCFPKDEIDAPEFKIFYDKDFTPIEFEELKKLITYSIEKSKIITT